MLMQIYAYAALIAVLLACLLFWGLVIRVALFGLGGLPFVGRWFADRQYFRLMGWGAQEIKDYYTDLKNADQAHQDYLNAVSG